MRYTVKELAARIEAELIGDPRVEVNGVARIDDVKDGQLTYVTHSRYASQALASSAAAFLVADRLDTFRPQLVVENPSLAFARIAGLFLPPPAVKGIHPTACVHPEASLASGVALGPQVVVEAGAEIGAGSVLEAGVYIGQDVVLGEDCHLHPRVVVERGCRLGRDVIIQAGTIVGSDGYGYEETPEGHEKIPHLGIVVIEDRVELGANVTVDRATTGRTVIGAGTKIDNLVQIGHNVKIGSHCLVVAMVGISGSSQLGDNVTLAGQVGISDHVNIVAGTTVAARGLVLSDIKEPGLYSGMPVQEHPQELRAVAARRRLPQMIKDFRQLQQEVEGLRNKISKLEEEV